jgi:hypothetical protein
VPQLLLEALGEAGRIGLQPVSVDSFAAGTATGGQPPAVLRAAVHAGDA